MRSNKYSLGIWILVLVLLGSCSHPAYDIVIRGGMILDGSGTTAYTADIAILQDKIVEIGKLGSYRAKRELDVEGKYISPGFIDMHTHCDNLREPKRKSAVNYLFQGVTTVVSGSCGSGTFKVDNFFNTLEKQGVGVNVVHLVGHGRVRSEVLKNANRAPTEEEIQRMLALITQAMQEGAAGLSSGLFYAPGSYSQTEEIVKILTPVRKHQGIYATHIRDESDYTIGLLSAIEEAITIGEQARIPVQISHIKALGRSVWGYAPKVAQLIEDARIRGVKVFADQYPYTASSTSLMAAVIPRWAQADGELHNRLQDPVQLAKIKPEIAANIHRRGGAETLVLTSFSARPEWEGKSLKDISILLKMSEVDAAVELVLRGGPGVVSFNMSEEDVEYFMQRPYVMTGSDGSSQVPGDALPHPRNYGAFTRKLRTYVLEKGLLTMEQAIRAATSLPAEMLNLDARGLLKQGYVADIVIFDPETIRDKATYIDPHQYSEGIEYVFISGKCIIDAGGFTGILAGKPIRHRRPNSI